MNKNFSSKASHTNWESVNKMQDKDIDLTDIPEIKEEQLSKAKVRLGGKLVSKGKVRINILLDADIVAYFKSKAGGRGYQTLINEALKENILHDDLESMLRKIVREELQGIH
jgi:uncharacterized protein (DUF4415 family)